MSRRHHVFVLLKCLPPFVLLCSQADAEARRASTRHKEATFYKGRMRLESRWVGRILTLNASAFCSMFPSSAPSYPDRSPRPSGCHRSTLALRLNFCVSASLLQLDVEHCGGVVISDQSTVCLSEGAADPKSTGTPQVDAFATLLQP